MRWVCSFTLRRFHVLQVNNSYGKLALLIDYIVRPLPIASFGADLIIVGWRLALSFLETLYPVLDLRLHLIIIVESRVASRETGVPISTQALL